MKDKQLPVRFDLELLERFKQIKEFGYNPSTTLRSLAKACVDIIEESERVGLILKDNKGLFLSMVKNVLPASINAAHSKDYKYYFDKVTQVVARKLKEQNEGIIDFEEE